MITPDEIREKALRLYPQMVAAWLADEPFFPRAVPANLEPSPVVSQAIAEQQLLRSQSKPVRGYGYTLRLESRRSRDYGQQEFITGISFEERDDLLRTIGKLGEFQRLSKSISLIRASQPRLESWLRSHWKKLLPCLGELCELLSVVEYLVEHPRPSCFIRELPLAISTKLVESHKSLLAQWLDELLPAEAIDFTYDRQDFAGRYGFRSPDDQFCLRILDQNLQKELGCPGSEVSLPMATLAGLPVTNARVILVENKLNLLTLPHLHRAVGLGGLGRAVTRLERVPWIGQCEVYYWGDLDIEGFQMLASVRRIWPHTRSLLMSCEMLEQFSSLVIEGNAQPNNSEPPQELYAPEIATYQRLLHNQWRLEQERIPQRLINACLEQTM